VWDLSFWLCTAAALWVWVGAFGAWVDVDGLVVSFGLAGVVAALPITPMGVGLVEPLLMGSLTLFGASAGAATLGVLGYRLVNFWLPIPLGALAYLSLEVELEGGEGREEAKRREAAELRRLAEQSLAEAEDRRAWADRHGLRMPPRGESATDQAED
jgi:Lysylphosphatidylglycerol synthase TM region